jgi:hypothetical protein
LAEPTARVVKRGGSGDLDWDLVKDDGIAGADSACLRVAGFVVVAVLLPPPFPKVATFFFGAKPKS